MTIGALRRDRFLHRGAARFTDQEMALQHQARQLIAPTDDLELVCPAAFTPSTVRRSRSSRPTVTVKPHIGQASQTTDDFRRGASPGIDHVRIPLSRPGRAMPPLTQLRELRCDGESRHADLVARQTSPGQHRGRLFVGDKKQVADATEPDRVDGDRIGNADDPTESRRRAPRIVSKRYG